jgi:hypothetical protein
MTRKWILAALSGIAVIAVLVFVVSGGSLGGASAAGPLPPPANPTMDAPLTWSTVAAEVVGVRPVDAQTVSVQVLLPAGRQDCARELRIEHVRDQEPDRPDVIYANVVYDTKGTAVVGGCQKRQLAEVELQVAQPLGERALLFSAMPPAWTPNGTAYRQCDETLGCDPSADHCDQTWIDKAVYTLDVPISHLHAASDVKACDGTWLVVDVNPAVGQCPPAEGAEPCRVPKDQARRVFMRFESAGWSWVGGTKEAGCGRIADTRPDFPLALCEPLPSPGS